MELVQQQRVAVLSLALIFVGPPEFLQEVVLDGRQMHWRSSRESSNSPRERLLVERMIFEHPEINLVSPDKIMKLKHVMTRDCHSRSDFIKAKSLAGKRAGEVPNVVRLHLHDKVNVMR